MKPASTCDPSPGRLVVLSAQSRDLIAKTGGVRPLVPTEWSDARLSLVEREEIPRGIAGGESLRRDRAAVGSRPVDGLERSRGQRRPLGLPGL